jgi:hypothetical protein
MNDSEFTVIRLPRQILLIMLIAAAGWLLTIGYFLGVWSVN